MTTSPIVVPSDVGNLTIKYWPHGADAWKVEPALVRTSAAGGFQFGSSGRAARPLVYLEGPAKIPATPFLLGEDADKHGGLDLAIVGSASMRVQSDAYLLLHLYTIVASLSPESTEAEVLFAGGLPARDSADPAIGNALKARLKGTHKLQWGSRVITLTIAGSLLVPQPVAAIATMLFTPDGAIRSNGDLGRKRFLLDIGGGTSDWTGRVGLTLIPGAEGGADLGLATAAAATLRLVQDTYQAGSITLKQIMDLVRSDAKAKLIYVHGEPTDISEQIKIGIAEASQAILAALPVVIHRELEQAELGICGGGGAAMSKRIRHDLHGVTNVALLPTPVVTVAEGIRRMARNRLRAA